MVLRTADIARGTGYSVQQVRNLERDGILPPVPRTPSGYRVYGVAHLWSVRAYRALAAGTGPVEAKRILREARERGPSRLFELLNGAHARLDRERRDVEFAREAARAIADEPVGDTRPADDMSISELARVLGIRASALRHWDAEGLVVPHRAGQSARRYTPGDVRAARLVHQLRLAGYGIESLRKLIPRLRDVGRSDEITRALAERDTGIDTRCAALFEAAAALHMLLRTQ
ncbi:MerR family transcriptional regulator [Nocardia jinanensis]|uniref:MerR family transcriptional regulator n=1 Tax=Nocardia jinanensis TaxID=382504 RepID=A0A917VWG3_9NOCA|nr:MerR family transcriptional regulator [Nocardia jinanensis]GGL32107.1 MerR family transcriptional regulator [Nocardia jinanensis]